MITSRSFGLLIVLAIILRFHNLAIGQPILYISNDEAIYHLSALNMIGNKTLIPLGNYGPLGSYIQVPFILLSFPALFFIGIVDSLQSFKELILVQPGYLLFIPRGLSAFFGVLSVVASYLLAKVLFQDKRAAFLSAILFAISFNLVHIAHVARSWSPAILFALIAAYLAVRSVQEKSHTLRNTLYSFFGAAICFGFHQISGIVIILILLITTLGAPKIYFKGIIFGVALFTGMIILFNFISIGGNIWIFLNPTDSTSGFIKYPEQLKTPTGFFLRFTHFEIPILFLKELILSDTVIVILAFIGFWLSLRNNRLYLAFFLFIIFNLILSAYFFIPLMPYFLIAFAFLPIFAGFTLSKISQTKQGNKILIMVILLMASLNSLYWTYLISKEPTFTQVRKWVDTNIDTKTIIATTTRRNFDYAPTRKVAEPIRKINSGYYKTLHQSIGDKQLLDMRAVVYLNEFKKEKVDNLEMGLKLYKIEYIIDSYAEENDRLYTKIKNPKTVTLLAHFSPTSNSPIQSIPSLLFDSGFIFSVEHPYPLLMVDRVGPYFDILKVNTTSF